MRLIFLEEVDSTNEYLKRVGFHHRLCVVAKRQTGGRGRRGKNWISKAGKGLYISFMFFPVSSKISAISSLAFGVAVLKTLKGLDSKFYLKWPNDVYINGKKISGILPELLKDRLIVGIGVNLNYTQEELLQTDVPATSLLIEGLPFDREQLLEKLVFQVNSYYDKLVTGRFNVREFEENCPLIGKKVSVVEGNICYTAKALGIDADGCLIVQSNSGGKVRRLFSANVSVRI